MQFMLYSLQAKCNLWLAPRCCSICLVSNTYLSLEYLNESYEIVNGDEVKPTCCCKLTSLTLCISKKLFKYCEFNRAVRIDHCFKK